MKHPVWKGLARARPVLLGLALVALVLAWSIGHPARPSMFVEGGPAFSRGTTPKGGYERHSWVVRNRGTLPLKLRTRFTSGRCGFSLWLGEDYFIPAGEVLTVSLTCPVPLLGSVPYSGLAEVMTDDPDYARVRFRLFGITAP